MDSTKSLSPAVVSSATEQSVARGAWRSAGRWLRRGLLILLLAAVLLLSYKAVRVGIYAQSAYQSLSALRATAGDLALDDSTLANLPALVNNTQEHTAQLADAVAGIEEQLRPFAPLLHRLDSVPRYGPTLAAGPELLVAGREFTALGAEGLATLEPALATVDLQSLDLQSLETLLNAVLADAQPEFTVMAARAARASEALNSLPAADLHPALGEPLSQVQPLLPLMSPMLGVAPSLPLLAGFDEPQTYLVVVQNNDELRATGGFFTSVGQITVDSARPTGFDFEDSSQVWSKEVQYAAAPEPMARFMNIDRILLRDANWSPDFPTSAQTIRSIYAQERGVLVDGIITVDTHAVELIVEALEPLTVQLGADEAVQTYEVTGENVTELTRQLRDESLNLQDGEIQGDWAGRKNFIPALVEAALARVQSGNADYLRLAEAGIAALDQRSIQLWMRNEQANAELALLGWNGHINPPDEGRDFVALVDSNLGYNKVDAAIERAVDYRVQWNDNGMGAATATVTYSHEMERPGHECVLAPDYGDGYEESIQRCYYNYVRLYVPRGSELIAVEGAQDDTVDSYRGERGTQVFAGYFILKPGKTHSVTFRYTLSPSITAKDYTLAVQRQSGTRALAFTAQIGDEEMATTIVDGSYEWRP